MTRWTATGPALDGCHEIDAAVAGQWIALGGQDIQVWGSEYILETNSDKALAYAVAALGLIDVQPTPVEAEDGSLLPWTD